MISKIFSSVLIASSISVSAFAADRAIGQKCRPLGPLRADDKVDMIAQCYCESAAFIAGTALDAAGGKGYFPTDIRKWKDVGSNNDDRKMTLWLDPNSNFVTLVESKRSGDKVVERYKYYQASDGESVEQFELAEVTVLASVSDDRTARCNVMSVSAE